MAVYLNERYSGAAHVTAADEAMVKGAIAGGVNTVIDHGSNLAVTVQPSAGTVAIADGVFSFCGRCGYSDGAEASFVPASGTTVFKKVIAGLEYSRITINNQETISFKCYSSEEKLSEAAAAESIIDDLPAETISSQNSKAFFALWEFTVNSESASVPVQKFEIAKSLNQLTAELADEVTTRSEGLTALRAELLPLISANSAFLSDEARIEPINLPNGSASDYLLIFAKSEINGYHANGIFPNLEKTYMVSVPYLNKGSSLADGNTKVAFTDVQFLKINAAGYVNVTGDNAECYGIGRKV